MCNVQEQTSNGNPPDLVFAIGKGPARMTRYGMAIDVVRIGGGKREWGDLVITNLEVLPDLVSGQCVEMSDPEIIMCWHRAMWRGTIKILEQ